MYQWIKGRLETKFETVQIKVLHIYFYHHKFIWSKLGLPEPLQLEAICDIAQLSVITDPFALRFPCSFIVGMY